MLALAQLAVVTIQIGLIGEQSDLQQGQLDKQSEALTDAIVLEKMAQLHGNLPRSIAETAQASAEGHNVYSKTGGKGKSKVILELAKYMRDRFPKRLAQKAFKDSCIT